MSDSLCVRHLRLRCRTPLASRVGVSARIEDALRTSSWPSAWHGRVILVRHLRLRVRERAPARQLAMAIETEWQRLARSAVEYVHAPPNAEAVWFAGQVEARLALVERLATDGDMSAWYWRRLLPLEPAASRDEQLVALFAAPWADLRVTDEEQMHFARMAFSALRSTARARRVVFALTETELERLLPLPFMARTRHAERGMGDAAEGGARTEVLTASIARDSLRARALEMAVAAIDDRLSEGSGSRTWTNHGKAAVAPRPIAPETASTAAEGVASGWAGLFFVLNLFEHAGDPPTVPSETVAVLRSIATWLRIRSDDAIYESLAALNADGWWPEVSPAKIRALRLACVTMTRRPLRRIVARAGRILITRTHLTIVCDLNSVRLDVRKAGLDLDPGWLPRLGRAVRFEYE